MKIKFKNKKSIKPGLHVLKVTDIRIDEKEHYKVDVIFKMPHSDREFPKSYEIEEDGLDVQELETLLGEKIEETTSLEAATGRDVIGLLVPKRGAGGRQVDPILGAVFSPDQLKKAIQALDSIAEDQTAASA